MKESFLLIGTIVLLISCFFIVQVYAEVDKTDVVTRVIDGDTFDISSGERVRLADVDAPEYYESGYSDATDYLKSLIDGKTVYLDVDDVYTYDYSGKGDRFVCVAYVDYDSTHWINVNQALLDEGHAVISNFHNEFSPYSWSLYVLKETPESIQIPSPTSTPYPTQDSSMGLFLSIETLFGIGAVLTIIVILAVAIWFRKKK